MESLTSIAYRKDRMKSLTDFAIHRRAQKCIAQTYLTNSKRPESLVKGVYPTHLKKGRGCYVWDHAGKKYMDFITGLGTNLLGYANETVNSAVISALGDGNLFSLGSEHEVLTAEKLKELFQFVDCFKFLKSGSEACSAAIRIARAHTNRDVILSEGYHGWHDEFVSLSSPAIGVPAVHRSIDWKTSYRLDKYEWPEEYGWSKVAAVIIEPIITDLSPARIEWLKELREKCTNNGVLLIFDEIITGFRFPKFSVAAYTGITPDLICLGKAMANGFPLAAVGGKFNVMNGQEYFVSSTYAGCIDALVACRKVCELLQKSYNLGDLWERGGDFMKAFNSIWPEKITIEGYPTRGIFKGDMDVRNLLMQEACFAGILLGPSPWFNFPLAKESFGVIDTLRDIIHNIQKGSVSLVGDAPQSPFAQRVRES